MRNRQWVAIVEGYPRLITDGDAAAALAAHTDFDQAIGDCLVFDAVFEQRLDVWDPFAVGGRFKLIVPPGLDETGAPTDVFGEDCHRTDGVETPLVDSLDRDDTAFEVASTADFGAPTEQGEVNIGAERIAVTVTDGTNFAVDTNGRGLNVPFGRNGTPRRFAHHHRAALTSDYQVPTEVLVTEHLRHLKGRRVGVFWHEVSGGVLEDRDDVVAAGRAWSFRIAGDVADDPESGATTIPLESEIEAISRTTLMRDPWSGRVAEGYFLRAGVDFVAFRDHDGSTQEIATTLEVVAAGAVAPGQVDEGFYTADEILGFINAQLSAEAVAGNLHGIYTFGVKETGAGYRVTCTWEIAGTAGNPVSWRIRMAPTMATFLGLRPGAGELVGTGWNLTVGGVANVDYDDDDAFAGLHAPQRIAVYDGNTVGTKIGIEEARGAFRDQSDSLPPWAAGSTLVDPALQWGIFRVDDALIIAAAEVSGGEVTELRHIKIATHPINSLAPGQTVSFTEVADRLNRRYGEGGGPMEVRQIVWIEGPVVEVLPRLFASTGTAGYNHATYDAYPYGVGLAIPWEILGDDFVASVGAMKGAHLPITIVLEKPIELTELLEADLIIRRAHLVWKDSHLEIARWALPTSGQAIHTLTEENKAEPDGQLVTHRVSSLISNAWAAAQVKLRYNRSLATGEYQSELIVEAPSLVDANEGKDDPRTVDCRNVYGDSDQFQSLLADFIATHAYFAPPIRTVRRSISPDLYHGVYPGEQALLTDPFARDPDGGARGIVDRPTTIILHMWAPPFKFGDAEQPPIGAVEVAMVAHDRFAVHGPCAEMRGSNYVPGTHTLGCVEHAHSAATDDVDARRFVAGYPIIIVEVDPDDPAAPLMWERNVASQTGADIVHDGDPLGDGVGEDPFDDTKTYHIIFAAYADAIAAQLGFAYQADNADARIQDLAPPFLYGDPDFAGTFAEDDHTAAAELGADLAVADGASRDTGYERGHIRLVEHLIDHKTAVQVPGLAWTETDPSSLISGDEWYATHQVPVFLGVQRIPSGMERYLYAAPWVRATTAGSKNWRVSLCSRPLTGDSLVDVDRQGLIAEVTGTTSNTTGEIPDVDPGTPSEGLSLRVVDHDAGDWSGVAWLLLEVQDECAARGFAHALVGWREET